MKTLIFIIAFVVIVMPKSLMASAPVIILQADSTSKDPLKNVLAAYLDLKNALAKDDEANVGKNGKALFKAIDDVKTDKLTTAQKNVWMKYYDKLSYDATHIKESSDIDHQREHFISLSKNMYAVITGFKTNSVTIYYQYCPMANNGKGAYWLSEASIISNPYLGNKMPTCGSNKDTLKATGK